MSDNVKQIKDVNGGMISVPATVLQDLIWNCGLAVAGMGKGEEYVGKQCRELQRYLTAALPTDEVDLDDFTLEEFTNVLHVEFGKK